MIEKHISWYKIARNFIRAGKLPLPQNDTVLEILKMILSEEQAEFLLKFKKSSYNADTIKTISDLDEESLNKMLNELMHLGMISGIASRRTGIMVYHLTPFFPGVLEFTLMRGETNPQTKRIAQLWEKYFDEMAEGAQKNFETFIPLIKSAAKSIDRVVPVEEEIKVKEEKILPFEELSKILEEVSPIGLMTCYCRHRKDLLEEPCKVTNNRKNCFSFNRPAKFLISQGFAEEVSKEKALEILTQCEEEGGLVHKAFHNALDPDQELDGMCACCKCCCGTFDIHYKGALPLMSIASYLAKVDAEVCIGCETCVEQCNAEAIELEDGIAVVDEERCIGCGLCAHHCPEEAMSMERTGPREVFVPPPKLTTNKK
jgi:ferredoxin